MKWYEINSDEYYSTKEAIWKSCILCVVLITWLSRKGKTKETVKIATGNRGWRGRDRGYFRTSKMHNRGGYVLFYIYTSPQNMHTKSGYYCKLWALHDNAVDVHSLTDWGTTAREHKRIREQ